jgi:hypothetical protein
VVYGRAGRKNRQDIIEAKTKFIAGEAASALGHREAAILHVKCCAQDKRIHDLEARLYLGDRLNFGNFGQVLSDENGSVIEITGKAANGENKRNSFIRVLNGDYIGVTKENTVLVVWSADSSRIEIVVKLRLRDIYTLRVNNALERVALCLSKVSEVLNTKLDTRWGWTQKLICLMALENLMRAIGIWENTIARDESRNEAAIKLMFDDTVFDSYDGLDEYNMYREDAEQRARDSALLVKCAAWLRAGGVEVAGGLRASDVTEKSIVDWKRTIENELGVSLPPLTKDGDMREVRRSARALTVS